MQKTNVKPDPGACCECYSCQLICSLVYTAAFNPLREGFGRADDEALPEVWVMPIDTPDRREALTDYHRIRELTREDVLQLLDDYYDERGWDVSKGTPGREKLGELGLDHLEA